MIMQKKINAAANKTLQQIKRKILQIKGEIATNKKKSMLQMKEILQQIKNQCSKTMQQIKKNNIANKRKISANKKKNVANKTQCNK